MPLQDSTLDRHFGVILEVDRLAHIVQGLLVQRANLRPESTVAIVVSRPFRVSSTELPHSRTGVPRGKAWVLRARYYDSLPLARLREPLTYTFELILGHDVAG